MFSRKVDGQSFRVSGGEQIQLFIICMKKSQNEWHTEYLKMNLEWVWCMESAMSPT